MMQLLFLIGAAALVSRGASVDIFGPSEVYADSGDNITLVCVGEGHLTWFYGETLVMEDDHHHIPKAGLLVVSHVTSEDSGVYTCTDKTGSQSISLLIIDDGDDDDNEDEGITSDESYQRLRNVVIGTVIGVGVAFIGVSMALCSVVALFFQQEKDRYRVGNEMAYKMVPSYTATINLDALKSLSPEDWQKINVNVLANLTNYDPADLEKYRPPSVPKDVGTPVNLAGLYSEITRRGRMALFMPGRRMKFSDNRSISSVLFSLHEHLETLEEPTDEDIRQSFLHFIKTQKRMDLESITSDSCVGLNCV